MNLYLVQVTKNISGKKTISFILAFGKDELKSKMLNAGFYEIDFEKVLDGYTASAELNFYVNKDSIEACLMDYTKLPFGETDEFAEDN